MTNEPVLLALKHAWEALERFDAPMAILGGIAVAVWDHARFTKDVDILLAVEAEQVEEIIDSLCKSGMRKKRDPPLVSIGDVDLVQLLYEPPDTFLDLQIDLMFARSEFHLQALERRVSMRLPLLDKDIAVLGCEDIIVLKLLAGRVIDRADAAALLRANRESMDLGHLTKWTARLGLTDDLAQIWDEAFPGEEPPATN